MFGRPSGRDLPWDADDAEVNADMWATADETREEIVELHEFSAAHSDATIEALPLDAPGVVPWWGDRRDVTLHQMLVHMCVETARHAGHADIVRELIDGCRGEPAGRPEHPHDRLAGLPRAARGRRAAGRGRVYASVTSQLMTDSLRRFSPPRRGVRGRGSAGWRR